MYNNPRQIIVESVNQHVLIILSSGKGKTVWLGHNNNMCVFSSTWWKSKNYVRVYLTVY